MPIVGRPAAIVWDFDGTLAETRDAVSTTLNAVLAEAGLPRVHPPFLHASMGLPLEALIARLVPPTVRPAPIAALAARYRALFPVLGAPKVGWMPGFPDALDRLSAAGIAHGIASSREGSSLHALLDQLGGATRFGAVVGCEDAVRGKPAPDLLEVALTRLGVAPEAAWMVGDTEWDVAMGRAAGVVAVGLVGGSHDAARLRAAFADAVVDDVHALVHAVLGGEHG
jgi:phosphoglycolate phosphatase